MAEVMIFKNLNQVVEDPIFAKLSLCEIAFLGIWVEVF